MTEADTLPQHVSSSPGCVLLIEDDDAVRDAFVSALRLGGFSVLTAKDGADALRIVRGLHHPLCVVLCDLMMPVMSGWEFIDTIDKEGLIPDVPTYAVTADGVGSKFKRKVEFLKKPINLDELIGVAGRHCTRRIAS